MTELLFQGDRRKVLLAWPQAVDVRLEVLVRAATAAGENVSRSQMAAALIARASVDPEELAQTLREYRRMGHADFIDGNTRDDLPTVRHPGPNRAEP